MVSPYGELPGPVRLHGTLQGLAEGGEAGDVL